MKFLLSLFILVSFVQKPATTLVGKWRLVSFDVPSPNDAGGVEVKLNDNEAYELLTITDQNQFEFRTMGGTMSKKDNFGTVQLDKTQKNVVFVSERYAGNSLSYIVSKLTKTELELKQQTRAGMLGRRYLKMAE